jgi:Holliday junction resolvase-like predicted endonuclease
MSLRHAVVLRKGEVLTLSCDDRRSRGRASRAEGLRLEKLGVEWWVQEAQRLGVRRVVLARNWRKPWGELDLVGLEVNEDPSSGRKFRELVFIEIRSRSLMAWSDGVDSVAESAPKRERLKRLVRSYLASELEAGIQDSLDGVRMEVLSFSAKAGWSSCPWELG